MPKACAVEAHARGYKARQKGFADATAYAVETHAYW
jgi:hypothetical protein